MSNLNGIVPKLLIWIIIDEVDLDLPCGVCAWFDELRTSVRGSRLITLTVVLNSSQEAHTPQVQKITLRTQKYHK